MVNKQAIVTASGRTIVHYEQHADLQRQSVDALLATLPQHKYTHILDAGCEPDWMSRRWRERHAQITTLDLSPPTLIQTRQKDAADRYLAGDIESLPLTTVTLGLAWSSPAVQWCGNLSTALRELYRVARPKGVVTFTTLVQGSLPGLHQAWQAVGECPYANRFLSPDEIEQSLNGVHYQHHIQPITLWFDYVLSAIHSLKDIGATHLHEGYDPRVLTHPQLQRLQLAWPQQQGRYSLTHHLFSGMVACE